MQTFAYPSKSGGGTYTVQWDDTGDGRIGCGCKGYVIKRKDPETGLDKARSCRHTEDVIRRLGLAQERRGDYIHAFAGGGPGVNTERLEARQEDAILSNLAEAEARGYVNPMLASALTGRDKDEPWVVSLRPFQNGKWLAEKKYDGERIVMSNHLGQPYFWSRPRPGEGQLGLPNQKVGQHIREAAKFLTDVTVDGEVVAGQGLKSYDVTNLANRDRQVLVLFDLLRVGNVRLLDKPLSVRRAMLEAAVSAIFPPEQGHCIVLAERILPTAETLQSLWDKDEEGLVLKLDESLYRPGYRSADWVKIKREFYETGEIIGYEKAKNGPYSKVKLRTAAGKETSVKTKDNYWLGEFAKNPDKYVGQRLVFKHYGPTPDGKFRGPIIWDHFAGEGE